MRLLVVTGRYPWPPWTGDRLRCHQWATLSPPGTSVTVLCPAPAPGDPAPPAGVDLHTFRPGSRARRWAAAPIAPLGGRAAQSGLFRDPALGAEIRRLAPRHDAVVLLLARLADHAGDVGATPLLVDLVDALSLNFATRARRDHWWLRPVWRLESRLLAGTERRLAARATLAVVSERDRRHLTDEVGVPGRVEVLPIAVEPDVRPTDEARDEVAIFTGNLGYFVNRDAAGWLLGEIWPAVRRRRPGARLRLAGARPPASLIRRARGAGVEVVGRPDDLRRTLREARVALAPLRCGAGVPIKVLEAWATSTPVVASAHAAAGVDGTDGDDLLVAGEPEKWAEAIDSLWEGGELGARLARRGRERLSDDYSVASVRTRLAAALSDWPR